ncbi:hypothetical protein [Natrinema marinum]|uniref:hypothetical protein n=1 Tax=Natrinema marinum TaxID=2961598 RepID=UPI0020C91DEF|nr:hypothetical protein [Natrinema marinum]
MGIFSGVGNSYVTLDEATEKQLGQPSERFLTAQVQLPFDTELPATLDRFVKGITEYQTQLLGLKNTSPTVAFEIQRFDPTRIRLQFAVQSSRLDRKVRTHLLEQIPGINFKEGTTKLPLSDSVSVGVGVLTLRRKDVYPLETEFERPPINSVITPLHPDAMRDTSIVIQILFKPMAGNPVGKRIWHREASKESRNLRSEKVGLLPWNDRDATPREKHQARRVDEKAGSPRFKVSARILAVGADEYTASRIKEVSGGFNVFASSDTGQSFRTTTVRSLRKSPIYRAVEAVRDRSFSHSFQLSTQELAALVSIPDREQENLIKTV